MLKSAVRYGLKPDEFYKMTPFELTVYLEAQTEKEDEFAKMAIAQAYITARLMRVKKFPSYNDFIKGFNNKKTEPKTDEQLLNQVIALNAQFGGEANGGN